MLELVCRRERRQQLLRWWGTLLLATTALSLLFSTRYFAHVELDASPGALAFRAVMLLGHLTMLSAVLLSPIAVLAWVWPRPRWVVSTGAVWSAAVLLALLLDTQVFHLYRFHINAGVLSLLFGGAARATFFFSEALIAQAFLIAAAVLACIGAIAALLWRHVRRTLPRPNVRRATTAMLLACIVSFHLTHAWADANAYEPIIEQTAVLPLRYAATAKRFLRAHGFEVRAQPLLALHSRADRRDRKSVV